jgi:uncharacterized protein
MMPALVTLRPAGPSNTPVLAAPRYHLLPGTPPLVFLVNGSRLFEVDEAFHSALQSGDADAERELFAAAGIGSTPADPATDLRAPTAVSLNIAQACNLSCTYCYADEGKFGKRPQLMSEAVALAAIDQLFSRARGPRVTLGFIGGEPFLNRPVLHAAVEYAARKARDIGKLVGFSVTSNGTLLTVKDVELLRRHSFAVTISLDGDASVNDSQRKTRNGASSWSIALSRLEGVLRDPAGVRLAARATITREDLRVLERVEVLSSLGFQDVGVSPLRTSAVPALALREDDWPTLLEEMIRAAEAEWSRVDGGSALRFSNLAIALKEIHRGSGRRLPCGAGANYASIDANGEYFTCHRTIGDPRFSLGATAPNLTAQERFVTSRDVDHQHECRSCWARYLCGGGCHAEVTNAGRSGCDYIRGWLEYCLRSYDRLLRMRPHFFEPANAGGEHLNGPHFSS